MSILAILLSLGLLIYLSFRGLPVLILAPGLAVAAAVFSGAPPLGSYTQIFMQALGGFVVLYFPIFLLGAIFGRLMESSGSAAAIAGSAIALLGRRNAITAIVLACAILTYGGVSLFVVAFAAYPVAVAVFVQADIPKRLIPASIALGAFTFTMTALPGTPAIQNAIPMPYFGTTAFAAPGLGVIAGVIMFALGTAWLLHRAKAAATLGEGYGETEPAIAAVAAEQPPVSQPRVILALTPVVTVLVLNYLLSAHVIPRLETGYLATPPYGATTIASVKGIWAIIVALTCACLVLVVLSARRLTDIAHILGEGASASLLPILNTASLVGFGAVIASLSGFAQIKDGILGIAPENPLISLSVAVNVLAGITGSASGGMSIALKALGDTYLQMGAEVGISPALLHRVTSIATGGLDALPHNGAVVTLLSICGLTHRQSYFDIFIVAVAVPILALIVVIALGTAFGSF